MKQNHVCRDNFVVKIGTDLTRICTTTLVSCWQHIMARVCVRGDGADHPTPPPLAATCRLGMVAPSDTTVSKPALLGLGLGLC